MSGLGSCPCPPTSCTLCQEHRARPRGPSGSGHHLGLGAAPGDGELVPKVDLTGSAQLCPALPSSAQCFSPLLPPAAPPVLGSAPRGFLIHTVSPWLSLSIPDPCPIPVPPLLRCLFGFPGWQSREIRLCDVPPGSAECCALHIPPLEGREDSRIIIPEPGDIPAAPSTARSSVGLMECVPPVGICTPNRHLPAGARPARQKGRTSAPLEPQNCGRMTDSSSRIPGLCSAGAWGSRLRKLRQRDGRGGG